MENIEKKKIKKPRIPEIDFIRGFLIFFMMVDHLFFDFFGIFSPYQGIFIPPEGDGFTEALRIIGGDYWNWPLRIGFRFFCLALFFLISGISCHFSRNNLKRGLILFGVGVGIDLGFLIFSKITNSNDYVFFGAISCFGLSILLYWFIRFIYQKLLPKYIDNFKWLILGIGMISVALGVLFNVWNVQTGGPPSEPLTVENWFKIIVGVTQHYGDDWLPLFPYFGLLCFGSFLGETIYKERKSLLPSLPSKPIKSDSKGKKVFYYSLVGPYKVIKTTVCFTGKYSLFFYLLHQIVLILLISIVLLCMGYTLNL